MSEKKQRRNGQPPNGKSGERKNKLSNEALWHAQFGAAPKRPGAIDRTISDHPLKPMYGPDDLSGIDYERDLSYPGQYPYTRGIHPTMFDRYILRRRRQK